MLGAVRGIMRISLQCDKLIIDRPEDVNERYIKRNIANRIREGQNI